MANTDRQLLTSNNINLVSPAYAKFNHNLFGQCPITTAVPAHQSYKSSLLVKVPGTYQGGVKFVEAPIKSHDVILGLPWLERVNPDIDWISKTICQRPPY